VPQPPQASSASTQPQPQGEDGQPQSPTLFIKEVHSDIAGLLPGYLLLVGVIVVGLLILLGIALFSNLAGDLRLPAASLVIVCFGVTMGLLALVFGVAMTWLGIVSAYSVKAGVGGGQQVTASLALASSSPGLFFALIGTALIGACIYRDVGFKTSTERSEVPNGRDKVSQNSAATDDKKKDTQPAPPSTTATVEPRPPELPSVVIVKEVSSFAYGGAPAPTMGTPSMADKEMVAPDFRQSVDWRSVDDVSGIHIGLYSFRPYREPGSGLVSLLYHDPTVGDKVFYFDPAHCQFTAVYDVSKRKYIALGVPNQFRSPKDVEKSLSTTPTLTAFDQMPPLPKPYEHERMLIPVLPDLEIVPAPPSDAPAAPAAPNAERPA